MFSIVFSINTLIFTFSFKLSNMIFSDTYTGLRHLIEFQFAFPHRKIATFYKHRKRSKNHAYNHDVGGIYNGIMVATCTYVSSMHSVCGFPLCLGRSGPQSIWTI